MATIKQFSFSSGEISASLQARTDFSKYASALKTARNGIIKREGGFQNRAGTEYVSETNRAGRLIPFVYDNDTAFIIEQSANRLKFIRDGEYVAHAATLKNITNVTRASAGTTITSAAHGFGSGGAQVVFLDNIGGTTELNGRYFTVTNASTNTFQVTTLGDNSGALNSAAYGAYTSGGTAYQIFNLSSPYAGDDILDYVQDGLKMYLVSELYAPRVLTWDGVTDDGWTISAITFAPTIDDPNSFSVTDSSVGSPFTLWYLVTAIDAITNEESLPAEDASVRATGEPTFTSPKTMSWSTSTAAVAYNVYRNIGGAVGLIGTTTGTTFEDTGVIPDFTISAPIAATATPFTAPNFPAAVGLFQQRAVFANGVSRSDGVWISKPNTPYNFTRSLPDQPTDPVIFGIKGQKALKTKFVLDLGRLALMTNHGEYICEGDVAGIITPTSINVRGISFHGCGDVKPVSIGNNAIFVQARNSVIRDLNFEFNTESSRGQDLTLLANHLFSGHQIVDLAYSEIPNSTVWAVRDDGVLLALTYLKEQEVVAWTRCDFQGCEVKNITVIPENNEDVLYIALHRVADGRYFIHRMVTRLLDDIKDARFMDGAATFDGRNTSSTQTMTLSGGTNWTYDEVLTLTSSAAFFTASDVGNDIQLFDTDGSVIRCAITAFTSTTVVSVMPNRTVPAGLRSVATLTWTRAVDVVTELWHLEGLHVSVFADGNVIASPNNPSYDTVTVSNGSITLTQPYGVIHVGLPYTSDLQTLSLDSPNGETQMDKKKLVSQVHMQVEETRGLFVGTEEPDDDGIDGLYEMKLRNLEGYDETNDLTTDTISINPESTWNKNGRVFVRQVDPIPMHILSIAPEI